LPHGHPRADRDRSRFVRPYRVADGAGFRLTDFEPGDTAGFDSDEQAPRAGVARAAASMRSRSSRTSSTPGPLGRAPHLPGDGCRRQGQRDQARHVGHQPAGMPGLLLQGPDERGARPRLPLALHAALPERGRIGIFNRSYSRMHASSMRLLELRLKMPMRPRPAAPACSARGSRGRAPRSSGLKEKTWHPAG